MTAREPSGVHRLSGLRRAGRPLIVSIVVLELAWMALVFIALLDSPSFGLDYRLHMEATRRMLATGTPYLDWQLNAPYAIGHGAILYPPTAFALFLPFLILPAAAWWAIPITVAIVAMLRHRPPLWTWPLTVGLFCLEKSLNAYVFGNPTMWLVAGVAAGTVLGWPFALVLLKPTFAPLALLGVFHRSWWVSLLAMGIASLVFGRMWLDWIAVVGNSDVTLTYNLPGLPVVLAPLIPWVAADPAMLRRSMRRLRSLPVPGPAALGMIAGAVAVGVTSRRPGAAAATPNREGESPQRR